MKEIICTDYLLTKFSVFRYAPDPTLWLYFNASSSIHYLMQQKDKMSEHKIGQNMKK